jgi:hypothetical protein
MTFFVLSHLVTFTGFDVMVGLACIVSVDWLDDKELQTPVTRQKYNKVRVVVGAVIPLIFRVAAVAPE